ncbi:hypothetical protein J7L02_01700, partial [Candidatus Woesearchaeota archaeon]|nr:hypothetical protein [Candidatus Woesearchaeota archaeon]
ERLHSKNLESSKQSKHSSKSNIRGHEHIPFSVKKRHLLIEQRLGVQDTKLVYEFAKKIKQELGDFIKAIILFGSYARNIQSQTLTKQSDKTSEKINDIDILIIIDDINFAITKELAEAYRLLVEKTIAQVSQKLHVTTFRFTSFWEYVRVSDPVAVNILRDGIPIFDIGFFEPLQILLYQGRIRPSVEAIYAYYNRAPRSLQRGKDYLLMAVIELYWAVMDSAHAVLMKFGEVPPSPEHVASIMKQRLVKESLISKQDVLIVENFYKLMKQITTKQKTFITGREFDKLLSQAQSFVDKMKKFLY